MLFRRFPYSTGDLSVLLYHSCEKSPTVVHNSGCIRLRRSHGFAAVRIRISALMYCHRFASLRSHFRVIPDGSVTPKERNNQPHVCGTNAQFDQGLRTGGVRGSVKRWKIRFRQYAREENAGFVRHRFTAVFWTLSKLPRTDS